MKIICQTALSLCLFALLLFACTTSASAKERPYNQGINIIPMPQSMVQQKGFFTLSNKTTIGAATPEARTIANFFANKMRQSTGYKVKVASKGTIMLHLNPELSATDEEYTLEVNPKSVNITAKTPHGLFNAMQSFMQLLPAEIESNTPVKDIAWMAPAVIIKDKPRFGYRGIMLDVCRHFMSVENIKKYLDVLSLFKIDRLHWHLTDDQGWRIEIKKYPKLMQVAATRIDGEGTSYGGYYTQEEIKDVVKYAIERFITVIPEIELPGHEMAAIAAYPELACNVTEATPRIIWGVEDIVMCPGKEETFHFLEDVFNEIIPLFPSEYYHIGGDECPKGSWKNCPLCQKRIKEEGLKGDKNHTAEERLQSYVIQRMEKFLATKGKKIIGWDEILEGGLAPSATVMSWRGEKGGIAAASMNHTVIMTPSSNGMYLDTFQGDPKIEPVAIGGYNTIENTYRYNPVPHVLVEKGKENYILGVQGNIWAEYMYTDEIRDYMVFPRILSVAEIGWTPLSQKNYKDFERRIHNAYVRLDQYGINYHIPQPEQPGGSCNTVAFTDSISLTFTTTRPEKIVYTLDSSEPTAQSTEYTTPITFHQSGLLKIATALPSGKLSKIRTISVEKQTYAPAKEIKKTSPGLRMQVYPGMYLNVTALEASGVAPSENKIIKNLNEMPTQTRATDSMRGVKQYAAVATGYVNIPSDDVYYLSSLFEEVWIDGKLVINNSGEVKRYARNDTSLALGKGLHEIKVVFLGHIIGGWPSNWITGSIKIRKGTSGEVETINEKMLFH